MCLGPGGPPHQHPTRPYSPRPSGMSCLVAMQDALEQQLRLILEEVARDHGLDPRALVGKYILRGQKDLSPVTLGEYPEARGLPPRPRPQGPRKGGRKPRFSTPPKLEGDLSEEFLRGLTIPLLKEACKMRKLPITGGKDVLVGRILGHQADPQPPVKTKKTKKKQGPGEPEHNHDLDDKTHDGCPQCATYGNPMDPGMQNEEFEVQGGLSAVPEVRGEQDFELGDDDLDAQLGAIVHQMNDLEVDGDETEDPLGGDACYGDVLEEED